MKTNLQSRSYLSSMKAIRLRALVIVGGLAGLTLSLVYFENKNIRALHEIELSFLEMRAKVLNAEERISNQMDEQNAKLREIRKYHSKISSDIDELKTRELKLVAVEQARRVQKINQICARDLEKETYFYYESQSGHNQKLVQDTFLVDERSKSIMCFNHKVASSSWMKLFTNLWPNQNEVEEIHRTRMYYKIADKMSPPTNTALWQKTTSGNYFVFTIVRHPFDRILSAYRDRIMNKCTGQAKRLIPKLLQELKLPHNKTKLTDEKGCITVVPSFEHFLQYVVLKPKFLDRHWDIISKRCSPCLVNYDAIIKLESVKSDQDYVMQESGISLYEHLEYRHETKGGKTERVRKEFFSQIPCDLLTKVYEVYKMDFEFFEYKLDPFDKMCQQVKENPKK